MICNNYCNLCFITVGMAFVVCAVNLHLLTLHHKISVGEIFLTHLHTDSISSPSVKQPAQQSSAYPYSCYRPSPKLKLQPNTTLPFPVINLGFPKMGTSSLHAFFGCAGYRSMHFRCEKTYACAECLKNQHYQNILNDSGGDEIMKKKVDLSKCGRSDVYSQIDRDDYFPQISILEEILAGHPNATYFLTFRTMEKWYHSISHWPPDLPDEYLLKNRLIAPGLKVGGNLTDYSTWFCNHVTRVREMMKSYPGATLVEIDIEDNVGTASYMSDLFDLDEKCWGRANVNFELHGDAEDETSDVKAQGSMPWFIIGKNMIRGKNGVVPRYERESHKYPPDILEMLRKSENNETAYSRQQSANGSSKENPPTLQMQKLLSNEDYCNVLLAHERGHWEQITSEGFISYMKNNPSFQQQLFPKEKEWMRGNKPWYGYDKCLREKNTLMYNSMLGHQCGCGVHDFEASLPKWVHDTASRTNKLSDLNMYGMDLSWTEYYKTSATLRLARKLAQTNATLCFAGDSIDYQIYYGMQNNLKRVAQLHSMHFSGRPQLVNVTDRIIPVKYNTEPGTFENWFLTGKRPPDGDGSFVNGTRPPRNGFGSMHSILETKASFREFDKSGSNKFARIRYFMTYGWSPWNIEFMESCNIVVMNLGLHYMPTGNYTGKQTRRPLMDDLHASFTYLANFSSSSENRISVWRSALPQHFDTYDGHFHGWDNLPKDHTCVDMKTYTSDTGKLSSQIYNALYDEIFATTCQESTEHGLPQSCSRLEHVCSVDVKSTKYPTIYKYWLDNNCTERITQEMNRLGDSSHVTGTISRWNIFDLFDNTKWHTSDMDCTHHCYVPSLYDTAFERLELLIAPMVTKFKGIPELVSL